MGAVLTVTGGANELTGRANGERLVEPTAEPPSRDWAIPADDD